jgi:hypothetical protein
MASNKKIERALNGPGPFEIILSIILSLVLGVLLAALHLIFKPVEIVKKAADAVEVKNVYFIEGAVNGSKARQWTRKRQMLAEGAAADVVFNEEELNAWMASAAPKSADTAPGAQAAPPPMIQPERINFRIQEGVLQAGLVGKLAVLGQERGLVVQTRGTFAPGADGFVFVPAEFYIGSLPVHAVPGLTDFLMKRLGGSRELPEDIKATWNKLTLVAVEGNTLRLTLP